MADKLEQGISVLTTFVAGETPTGAKLNSITAQLRNAASALEKAVGDIRDQSYPYSSSTPARLSAEYGRSSVASPLSGAATRSLDIANLARLIGPASNLNPEMLDGSRTVTEEVPLGVTEFSLNYPPETVAGVSFTAIGVGEAFENTQLDPSTMAASGDYYIDTSGRVFCTLPTDAVDAGTVTYTIDPDSWHGGPDYLGSRFNVMPDPNQLSNGGSGCAVGALDSNGRRPAVLPTVAYQQMNDSRSSTALSAADPNFGQQLNLPLIITGNYSVGEEIPSGFLVLKNWTTGEVYDQAEYLYNGPTSVLVGQVDITTEVDRGDAFVIITVGSDITTSIDDLKRKSRHAHDRTFGEPMVPAASITDWTAGPWGSKGGFTVSDIEGNYAPQYLHRYGFEAGENAFNDDNAMRGSLLIGLEGGSPGSYVGTGSTYSVGFGEVDRTFINRLGTVMQVMNLDGRVDVYGEDRVNITSETDYVNIDSSLNLSSFTGSLRASFQGVFNVSLAVDSSAGNISAPYAKGLVDQVALGNTLGTYGLDLWAIDENGSTNVASNGSGANHYATTQTTGTAVGNAGWVVPSFQVLHYAQWNLDFVAYDEDDNTGATWNNTTSWQAEIELPTYLYQQFNNNLGGNAVLGVMVMVKSSVDNERWWSAGGSARYDADGSFSSNCGERVIAYIDKSDTTLADNVIRILVAADGDDRQSFHKDRFQGGDAGGDPAGPIDVDVKITLIVAGPNTFGENLLS